MAGILLTNCLTVFVPATIRAEQVGTTSVNASHVQSKRWSESKISKYLDQKSDFFIKHGMRLQGAEIDDKGTTLVSTKKLKDNRHLEYITMMQNGSANLTTRIILYKNKSKVSWIDVQSHIATTKNGLPELVSHVSGKTKTYTTPLTNGHTSFVPAIPVIAGVGASLGPIGWAVVGGVAAASAGLAAYRYYENSKTYVVRTPVRSKKKSYSSAKVRHAAKSMTKASAHYRAARHSISKVKYHTGSRLSVKSISKINFAFKSIRMGNVNIGNLGIRKLNIPNINLKIKPIHIGKINFDIKPIHVLSRKEARALNKITLELKKTDVSLKESKTRLSNYNFKALANMKFDMPILKTTKVAVNPFKLDAKAGKITISGRISAPGTVSLYVTGQPILTKKTNRDFSFTIDKQNVLTSDKTLFGSSISLTASGTGSKKVSYFSSPDLNINLDKQGSLIGDANFKKAIIESIPTVTPKINKFSPGKKVRITGTATPKARIFITKGGKQYHGTANAKGKYSVPVGRVKSGGYVEVVSQLPNTFKINYSRSRTAKKRANKKSDKANIRQTSHSFGKNSEAKYNGKTGHYRVDAEPDSKKIQVQFNEVEFKKLDTRIPLQEAKKPEGDLIIYLKSVFGKNIKDYKKLAGYVKKALDYLYK